jgi:hypothetical protein
MLLLHFLDLSMDYFTSDIEKKKPFKAIIYDYPIYLSTFLISIFLKTSDEKSFQLGRPVWITPVRAIKYPFNQFNNVTDYFLSYQKALRDGYPTFFLSSFSFRLLGQLVFYF